MIEFALQMEQNEIGDVLPRDLVSLKNVACIVMLTFISLSLRNFLLLFQASCVSLRSAYSQEIACQLQVLVRNIRLDSPGDGNRRK